MVLKMLINEESEVQNKSTIMYHKKKSYFLVLSKEVRYPSALGIMTSHRGMLVGKAFFRHPVISIYHVK